MGRSAYIKLVDGSAQQEITIEDVKNLLDQYVSRMTKLGDQLDWEYEKSAFPYTVQEKMQDGEKYLQLTATDPLYTFLLIGVGKEEADGKTRHYVQVTIPDEEHRTPGDVAKGNEFTKYLGKHLKAETHLFNGRIIYNNPRK
ncbi:uncharacterized protein DUF1885 [Tepidibacillus fermentans]|uniref:Uncharacterized protein DUF1885 n=1 Tax=Tepidibacillus fermentans TaxID=1281767 RepID=A0A4R3KLY5_9BACI|nr:uncharacterized protein DUF1885 [Tepidibacillus fermentans]